MIALPQVPAGENRMIVASFVSTKHRNVTEDGQTDRHARGIYSAGIASMPTRCKNDADITQSASLTTEDRYCNQFGTTGNLKGL